MRASSCWACWGLLGSAGWDAGARARTGRWAQGTDLAKWQSGSPVVVVVVVPPMPPHPEILGLGRLLASKCLHWHHPRENSNQTLLHSGLDSLAPMVSALACLWSAGRAIRGWSLAALTQRSAYARLRGTSTREEHSGTRRERAHLPASQPQTSEYLQWAGAAWAPGAARGAFQLEDRPPRPCHPDAAPAWPARLLVLKGASAPARNPLASAL